jgi:CBS domain-containing protein
MSSKVYVVEASDTLEVCALLMSARNIGFVPVVDGAGKVLGVVTDRDLTVRGLGTGKGVASKVREVMTPKVVSCAPDDELASVERLMCEARVTRVVVLAKSGECVGVLSLSDVLRVEQSEKAAKVLRAIAARESMPPPSMG